MSPFASKPLPCPGYLVIVAQLRAILSPNLQRIFEAMSTFKDQRFVHHLSQFVQIISGQQFPKVSGNAKGEVS